MGNRWALLYVLGSGVLFLGFLATLWLVVRAADRLNTLRPGSRPAWQYALAHVLLHFAAARVPALAAPAMAVVPGVVLLQVERARRGAGSPPAALGARRTAAFLAAAGVALPWLTGLGVKLYLDSRGLPTLPFSAFLGPVTTPFYLGASAVAWAYPFLFLAVVARYPGLPGVGLDPARRGWTLPVWGAFAAGVATATPIYVAVFREWDALLVTAPLGTGFLLPMTLGYAAGWGWTRLRPGALTPTPPAPGRAPPAPPGTPAPPPAR
ncbi:MAG: hypothetical protein RQ751_12350 [Longimicrobiales bacterium]|nr:hypothetical protein [Longimicrobiales bacterium]